ncbi:hypothetical protein RHECNPAF_4460039 [Rhizobium etli CNPAF512]|nr:hypothetical protein RHECNPAF_4460039 [Rhizobium etli CNPAF512]
MCAYWSIICLFIGAIDFNLYFSITYIAPRIWHVL